jgi:hypothetical protein
MANGTEKYYDHMSLPGKGPVYFRDAKLREGRDISVSGDVEADSVKFDGSGDVNLVTRIGDGAVTLKKISPDAVAKTLDDGGKLATAEMVRDAVSAETSFVIFTARLRPSGKYIPDRTYAELVHYMELGKVPVLRVWDGHSMRVFDLYSSADETLKFRATVDYKVSPEERNEKVLVPEFTYTPTSFSDTSVSVVEVDMIEL